MHSPGIIAGSATSSGPAILQTGTMTYPAGTVSAIASSTMRGFTDTHVDSGNGVTGGTITAGTFSAEGREWQICAFGPDWTGDFWFNIRRVSGPAVVSDLTLFTEISITPFPGAFGLILEGNAFVKQPDATYTDVYKHRIRLYPGYNIVPRWAGHGSGGGSFDFTLTL